MLSIGLAQLVFFMLVAYDLILFILNGTKKMKTQLRQQLYFIKEVEQLIGRDRQTLRRWWTAHKFPKPTLVSNRLAWPVSLIDCWLNHIINKSSGF
jgi:predicted DNA-binding transcriptional regulator AlpA